MKKLHLAISTDKIEETIADYSRRFGISPCVCVQGEYALWRTKTLNVSIRHDATCPPGTLRHLGWEDATAEAFLTEIDVNGIIWERFSAQQQADEINETWSGTDYRVI